MAEWEDRLVRRDINNNGLLDNDDYYSIDWGNGEFNNGYWKVGKKNDMTNVNKYLGNDSKFNNFKNVKELQKFLVSNGYNNVKVDGYAGLQTMNALKDYIDREEKGR
jgi:lysozyme family protein